MSFRTTAAPCALLAAASLAAPASAQALVLAQTIAPPAEPTLLDSVIVTGRRNTDDPAVAAVARNLTDERYAGEFSAVTDAAAVSTAVFFPGEGRALYLGLRIAY